MSTPDKVLSILNLFSLERSEWTVEQAAQEIGQPVSTTYRHFAVLAKAGLIDPARNGRYILGPAAIQLDWLIRNTDPLLKAAQPAIMFLTGAIDRPAVVLLGRLYRNQMICIDQATVSNPSFGIRYQRGRVMPLTRGAASKSILANLPDRTKKALYQRHAEEFAALGMGATWPEFRAFLADLRKRGYSVSQAEVEGGVVAVAAPVMAADNLPIGTVAYVVDKNGVSDGDIEQMGRMLKAAAAQISTGVAA
jgi:DNA-binding IclR family transcriptional regulator